MMDGPVAPPVTRPPLMGEYAFAATFPGRCSDCDGEIEVGERIAKMNDGTYQHGSCVARWEHR